MKRQSTGRGGSPWRLSRRRVGRAVFGVPLVLCLAASSFALAQAPSASSRQVAPGPTQDEPAGGATRTRYRIDIDLNFDARTYAGSERVRWTNADDGAASLLFFHLYPNLRAIAPALDKSSSDKSPGDKSSSDKSSAEAQAAASEPSLEVMEVRAAGQPLVFSLDDGGVTLRVQLREAVAAGASVEVEIKFKGRVPEIDPDQTSLSAHLIQQVGAALRDTPEQRSARHLNFFSRGVLLLGAAFPVLAAREGGDWQRKVEPTVGDIIHADAADYEVAVNTSGQGLNLFASGELKSDAEVWHSRRRLFAGVALRGFALIAGRTLRSAEREVSGVRVRTVYAAEHERAGRRVLEVAAEAVKVFAARFGPLPFKSVTVAEAPLVAGVGSAEFSGLAVIASAFYADFDSPAMRGLPEVVREQRASVEDSLEFAAAHMVAHQWWGESVGSDPARSPVLDESLAHWSALNYYREAYGEERAQGALDDQLRGVYQIYRTFGGEDMPADRPARDYRNSFQYAAIVASKGALMIETLKGVMGERRFWRALQNYYETHRLGVAEMDDLRAAFSDESDTQQRRMVLRVFDRWLSERHGDEDIAAPNPQLAAALGISGGDPGAPKDRNAFSRLGRFFWRQMTRIR